MTRPAQDNERFLSRWSRLKRAQANGADAALVDSRASPNSTTSPVLPSAEVSSRAMAPAPAPLSSSPTTGEGAVPPLQSIESLTMESDYGQFFQPKVPEALRRAAVKKLFADPHFNIMDGLDTYIDDYTKPDPLPPEMLARLLHVRDIIDHPSDRKPEAIDGAHPDKMSEGSETMAVPPPDAPSALERAGQGKEEEQEKAMEKEKGPGSNIPAIPL